MTLFFVAFIIAMFVFVLVIRDKKKTEDAWTRLASNLKLTYYDVGGPSLRGQFRDQNVHITTIKDQNGSQSQTCTQVEVRYDRFLNTVFQLQRQGYLQSAKNFLGAQDIIVGHPDFDAAVVVKGPDEKAVRNLFQRRSVREACRSVVSKSRYTKVTVSNKKIEVSIPGKAVDTTRIRAILNHLVDVVEVLKKAEKPRPKQTKLAPPPLPKKKEPPLVPEEWHGPEIEPEEIHSEPAAMDLDSANREANQVELAEATPGSEVIKQEAIAAPIDQAISLAMIADSLLGEDIGRYEAGKRFDELFKGESVSWISPLESIASGSSDRAFGRGSGWIAQCSSDNLTVKYRIGNDHRKQIENRIGSPVEWKGTLLKYDPFSETLYLQSDDPPDSEPDRIISKIVPYSERIKKEVQTRPGEVREFS